ncbi:Hypothetical predicted protein [Mytilus galloprovincialis]|uniref:Mutator-like transposase domain-containing protein n=1 Tax=Mytilus galloprovincialis TaxID=29158 RepID=A0A8B6FPH1_MYTGA|nr:Hypothetical predicted protein [Mytilus galloprovincialis]
MQVGLSQVSMGLLGLRKILLSGNIPAPSTKGMQNSANKVNEKIEIQNVADMADIRTELKTINKMRGHPESHIDVEGDGCYNNPLYSGIGKTPFQPATQSCYVVVENMTDKKIVTNLVTKNKLCSHGKDHSNENINKKNCKCTQNLQMVESIGNEQRSARESLSKMYSEGFEGIEDPWINRSIYLPKTFKLNLTLKQQTELRKCINYRLCPKELERTKLGTNTQKSECVNRIIRRSLPRSNTFSKNFQGRANSAVSSATHGPGESVMALCLSVGAPVAAGSKVHTHLQQEQKIYENQQTI